MIHSDKTPADLHEEPTFRISKTFLHLRHLEGRVGDSSVGAADHANRVDLLLDA